MLASVKTCYPDLIPALKFAFSFSSRLSKIARLRKLANALLVLAAPCVLAQNVTTWHYDNERTGVQPNETILTPSNVNSNTFGKLFAFSVQGDVYAEPLYVSQVAMPDGNLHNVLIVATAEDFVYAFDADGNNPSQGYLWCQSMLPSGETWVSASDQGVTDITPNIGIIGTPVIDADAGIVYLVAKSKTTSTPATFYQRLHALNIADGSDALNGPSVIQASVPGTGYSGSSVTFSALQQNQRPALLLASTPGVGSGDSILIGWGSNGDVDPYHGWIMAYDAANIANQNGVWTTTPNGERGGIWMSGGGPSSDNNGNFFVGIGNGDFDAASNGIDFGDSAVRLKFTSSGLTPVDYFTPGDQETLETEDGDMGISAVTLLPVQTQGVLSNLAVTADKHGTIYLLDADKMAGYVTPGDSSLQDFAAGSYIHSSFAFFNNMLYEGGDSYPMQAWSFDANAQLFGTSPSSSTSVTFGCSGSSYKAPAGPTPSISANGTSNAIVWALDNSCYNNKPAVLHAYDPNNLGNEFYNSSQAANNRDQGGVAIKFTTPTIANGKVYVGGRNQITVYGLLPESTTATPQLSPKAGTYIGTQQVQITDSTKNASIYYTTDGSAATTSSTPYSGALSVSSSETINAVAIAPNFTVSNDASATFTITKGTTATPMLSLKADTYTGAQSVSITDATSKASIYYTTNGASATASSTPYTGPITVSSSETINTVALASGYSMSADASAAYVIKYKGTTATPKFSLKSGAYTGTQTVKITDSSSSAVIYYTTNGTPATTSSTKYTGAISVTTSETINAIAIASGYSLSSNTSATYTIDITSQATQTQVSLASAANTIGIFVDGAKVSSSGVNGSGDAYSATLLGSSIKYSGITYSIGKSDTNDVVKGAAKAPVISLPAGSYTSLNLLGAAVNANLSSLIFTVTYTDGSTSTFTQSMSNWGSSQKYSGEAIALTSAYRDVNSGSKLKATCYLYQYSFALSSAKMVKSLTLPANSNAVVVAVTLVDR